MPKSRRRVRRKVRKTKKTRKVRKAKKNHGCKYNCKQCGKLYKSKNCYVRHEKKCVKKKYCCVKLNILKKKTKKKMQKIRKRLKKYKQKGCSRRGCRQRGGALLDVGKNTFDCDDASNMGEIRSGSKYNDYSQHDLTSESTQNHMVQQSGGGGRGLGMLSEQFGLGQAATSLRNIQNTFVNGLRTWNGDHAVASANVTVPHANM
jgi:hypothetical protein